MKNYGRLLAVFGFIFMGAFSHMSIADDSPKEERGPRMSGVTIDPIRWAWGTYLHQAEMAFSDKLALTIPRAGFVPAFSLFQSNTVGNFGWLAGVGLGLKYYFIGKALSHGAYLHPQAGLSFGQMGTPNNGVRGMIPTDAVFTVMANYSVYLGYVWVADNGFMLDAYVGFNHFVLLTNPATSPAVNPDAGKIPGLTGLNPYVGLLIGYAW